MADGQRKPQQAPTLQTPQPRPAAGGGTGYGGSARADGGHGGEGGQGGHATLNQTVKSYPDQKEIDRLQAENSRLSDIIQGLNEKIANTAEYQKEQKARFDKWETKLKEQDEEHKERQKLWKKAQDHGEEARLLRIEEEEARLRTKRKETEEQVEKVKMFTVDLAKMEKSRDGQVTRNEILQAEVERLEREVKNLLAQLDRAGRWEPNTGQADGEEGRETKLLNDIKSAEADVEAAQKTLSTREAIVTRETANKDDTEKLGETYQGPLESNQIALLADRRHLEECKGKLEGLKAQRRPRLSSIDSYSTALDSATTADTDSTAPSEWSVDCECGKSMKLEYFQGRITKSVFRSITAHGKLGKQGEGG